MKIKILPIEKEIEGSPDKSLMQICLDNGVQIKSICKGIPQCSECRVKIVGGEHNILPPTKTELNLIGTSYFVDSRRLSCQVRCFGDVTIDITEQLEKTESQNKKVRGFKSKNQTETKAVQDTFLLSEKPEDGAGRK